MIWNPSIASVVQSAKDPSAFKMIVATDRIPFLSAKVGSNLQQLEQFTGVELVGLEFQQPLNSSAASPVLAGDHVVLETGTGLVHTAPGHGLEDFAVCSKAGIPTYCPVDENGCFTAVRVRCGFDSCLPGHDGADRAST